MLIEDQGMVRTVSGLWTVVVTLHPPARPNVTTWADGIRQGIQKVPRLTTPEDREVWLDRMAALSAKRDILLDVPTVVPTNRRRRARRGLFDFVGKLSKSLFGTATEDDIRVLSNFIRQNQQGINVLQHNVGKLISVGNQTRRYVRENRMDLQDVRAETARLHALATATARRTQALEFYRGRASIRHHVDLAILQMEMAIRDYRQGHDALDIEWYYQHVRVTPLWREDRELLFCAVLPAVAKEQYLQYGLEYFKVPMDDHHLRQLVGQPRVAVSTLTGTTFVPKDCAGTNPIVCDPTARTLVPTCESALVTGQVPRACQVAITPRRNTTAEVFCLSDRTLVVVVAYVPTATTLRCRGQPPVRMTIKGPQQVHVPDLCLLEAREWRVSGIQRGKGTVHLSLPTYVQVPGLNVSWPRTLPPEVGDKLKFTERVEVPLVDMDRFVPDKAGPAWPIDVNPSYFAVPAVSTILIAGTVLFIVCIIWRRKRRLSRSHLPSTLAPTAPAATALLGKDRDLSPNPHPYRTVSDALETLPYLLDSS